MKTFIKTFVEYLVTRIIFGDLDYLANKCNVFSTNALPANSLIGIFLSKKFLKAI